MTCVRVVHVVSCMFEWEFVMADQDERESLLDAWISLTTIINNDRLVSVLPYNEAVVCRILLQHVDEDITATELCKIMNMQKSQMNHTLAAMEHKNLSFANVVPAISAVFLLGLMKQRWMCIIANTRKLCILLKIL